MAEAENFFSALNKWPLSRKISLVAAAAISLAIFAVIIIQAREADYRLLYANMSTADASSVVDWLKEQKIPYQLKDGGKSIQVPAEKVYEARLELAGANLPQGGGVGFEIFDKQSFGITDFAQKVNYQRALQGELARTISSLAPVEGARVMLALPEKRLFKPKGSEASASVILKLRPGRELKENQVQGVVHLVSGSIDGLGPENVTVIDSTGRILSRKSAENLEDGALTPGMLDYQLTIEDRLEKRAQSLLDRALGVGNSLARVTASIDFSKVEKMEEIYDPNGTVVRSEQISKEKSSAETAGGGIPGVQANLNNNAGNNNSAGSASPSSSRNSETTNYEVSKVVNKIVAPVGMIKNLSVAVLVADRVTPAGADGQEPTSVPRDAKEIQTIENMVKSALGLDETRGDQIKVVSMAFAEALQPEVISEPAPAPVSSVYEYMPFIKYGLLALAGGLFYFLMIRPLMKTVTGSQTQPYKTVQELESELSGQQRLLAANDPVRRMREEILTAQTSPSQVVKSWLNN